MKNRQDISYSRDPETRHGPSSRELFPLTKLPERLDELLNLLWTPEASRLVDCWLWYGEREFELGGAA